MKNMVAIFLLAGIAGIALIWFFSPAPQEEAPFPGITELMETETPPPSQPADPRFEPEDQRRSLPQDRPRDTPPPASSGAALIDSAVAEKWYAEEGYTEIDIADAQALLREQGFPEDRLTDPGLIRRHLLPRVVTSVQITEINTPERAPADTAIPFTLKGAVPTPEFNFVRFDVVRQDDIIRIRALGHSAAFDETYATAHQMLPVELSGRLEPLPAGKYRILIPELGSDGIKPLIVE